MLARADGVWRAGIAVRPLEHGIAAREHRTAGRLGWSARRCAFADRSRRSAARPTPRCTARRRRPARPADRARASPPRRPPARPSRRSRRELEIAMVVEILRRPAADAQGTQSARRCRCSRLASNGVRRAVMSARMTTGNSSPLALCTVIRRTPSLPSSRMGASAACAGGLRLQRLDEPAERHASVELVLARQLGDVQHVGERLLAGRPQHEADVRPRLLEQPGDGVGHRRRLRWRCRSASVSSACRTGNEVRRQRCGVGQPERMKPPLHARDTRAAPRRRARRARRAAWQRPTAGRRAIRWPSAPRAAFRSPRDRETPCRRRAGGGCRAPRAPRRSAA